MEQLGVQLTPWSTARDLVAVGARFGSQVDTVFVQDQMLARNVYAVLAALATNGCGVGTNVTWPFGRNPIEMASAAATIAELLAPGRTMTLGMGSGGALVSALFDMSNRAAVVEESVRLLRALWSGAGVALDDYPRLGRRLGFVPGASARLSYPVPEPPKVVIACVGPRMMRTAADLADGFLCASNLPPHSRAALESGFDADCAKLVHDRAAADPTFAMHYGMNVSVATDGAAARMHARRQAALIVGNPGMWAAMEALALDVESAQATKTAFDEGLGVDGASRCVAQSVVDALIVAGTAEEVVEPLASLRATALDHGYTDFFLGGPLGPDPAEAADLLCDVVIPAIWPDRKAGA
jgi:alkanesulfonate monooxygenase SsuD/methylene tetrahydromethanopterin reductase-like flavin-dependent oxidoreductase (luciferase family)